MLGPRRASFARAALLALSWWLLMSDAAGARDESTARPLPAVRLDGNYFSRNGHRFIPVGAQWVPAKTALHWPLAGDEKDIDADFAQMAHLGFNTVRLDLMWAWFEPRPGDYNPRAFQQLDHLVALAHRYHLYLHPSLFIGGEIGEAWWDVPWRMGRDPQSDPDMLRWETNLAEEFGRRYGHETAIIAWDLTDEPPFWISDNVSDAMAVNWTRLIAYGIRKYDRLHPIVVGVSTQDMEHGPFRPDTIADDVDFFSVHPYTIYTPELFPDAMVSQRGTYGAAFETTLSAGAGKPVMMQELGASSAQYAPEKIVDFDRASLYSALGAGANGFLLWCYTDAAPELYRQVPYLRSAHETQFGLTTWDRKVRPQGAAFEKFEQVVGQMNLDGIAPARADAAIVIPDEWSHIPGDQQHFGLTGPAVLPYVSQVEGGAVNGQAPSPYQGNQWLMSAVLSSFILAHQAGLKPAMPRELADWTKYPIVLLPSPLTATDPISVHVHTDFWARAANYVKQGGVLYASLSADAAVPQMTQLFGARMTDSIPVSDVTLRVVKAFGDLTPGETFHFSAPDSEAKYWGTGLEVGGGEVIAVDQSGRPALVANRLGQGRTLLSAYPLEAYLGNRPMAFDAGETPYRLYRSLLAWSGVRPLVTTDQPVVEATALDAGGHGYFVLVNHSGEPHRALLSTTLPAHTLKALGDDPSARALKRTGAAWSVEVPAWDGVVLEWRH